MWPLILVVVKVVVVGCHYSEAYRNSDAKFRMLDWKEEEQKENKQADKLRAEPWTQMGWSI